MGQPAAKQGDAVTGMCVHIILVPSPGGPVPTPIPHPFNGILSGALSADVKVMGMPVAVLGSTADNTPPHVPMGPGPFQVPPRNKATIITGSPTVMVNNKPMARLSDTALICADPTDIPAGQVIGVGTVFVA